MSKSTSITYQGDGTTNQFAIPFNYIKRSHVSITVNGIGGIHVDWGWVNDNLIEITPTPAIGSSIQVSRSTPVDQRMVDFVAGNTLSEASLDLSDEQSIYAIQELHSKFNSLLSDELKPYLDAQGVAGTIDPKAMIQGLVQSILDSDLLAELQSRITDIDINGNMILQTIDTQLAANLAHAVLKNRVDVTDINITDIRADITTATAFINRVEVESLDGRDALASLITSLQASNGDLSALIQQEQTTRTSQFDALASTVNTLQAQTNRIFTQPNAPVEPTDAISVGDVWYDNDDGNHPYRWNGTDWIDIQDQSITSLQASLQAEQTVRINQDTALAQDITTLTSEVNTNKAAAELSVTTLTTENQAIASDVSLLATKVDGNDATAQSQITALSNEDLALSQSITNLTASANSQFAIASSARQALSNGQTSQATDISSLFSKTGNNEAAITSEQVARTSALASEAQARGILQAEFNANERLLQNPELELGRKFWSTSSSGEIVPDATLGTILNAGRNGGKAWEITGANWLYSSNPIPVDTSKAYRVRFRVKQTVDNANSRVYAGVATLDSNYQVQTGGAGTHRYCAVAGQTITVSGGWMTFEGVITGEGDTHNNFRAGTAYVRPMLIVNYNGGTGTVHVDSLEFFDVTGVEQNLAAIQTEATARASGDAATTSLVNTLQTTVNGNTSSISSNLSSINGLNAQWTIKTDVNGYVAGVGLSNSGTSSEFIVLADKFAVVYAGQPKVVPFVVGLINGVSTIGMTGNLIVDGTIATNAIKANAISADKINVTNLSAISANMGTVTGGTFRTAASGYRCEISSSGSFPLWYGTGTKNATNAVFYVDSSGNALFKGSLTAGSIDTIHLAENSITEAKSYVTSSTSKSVGMSVSHSSVGKPCRIEIPVSYHDIRESFGSTFPASAQAKITVTLKRGTTALKSWTINSDRTRWSVSPSGEPSESFESNDIESSLVFVDSRTTEEIRSYSVLITRTGGLDEIYANAQYFLLTTEFKR